MGFRERGRTLPSGAIVGGYRIERPLGSGGMGQVYLATHPRLPRQDAIKVLGERQNRDPEYRARFIREAEVAGRLDHPNLVPVYDFGVDTGLLWMAMRFVDGCTAADLIRRPGGLQPEQAVAIVAAAAQGLDAVHESGLLHRDVKPANILVAAEGNHVMVTDFGIARVSGTQSELTAAGSVLATLAYAAPEQLTGAALDHRVDVYGLGATLYQLLTGTVPFPRETVAAVMRAQLVDPPPRPSRAVPALSRAMDAVIARAMAKDPARRFTTCGELAAAAHAALERPAAATGRRGVSIAVGAVLAVIVAAGFLLSREPSSPAVEATSPPPLTTPTTVSPWGSYQFIVDAFPALLPTAPGGLGYQNLSCAPAAAQQTSSVPLDAVASKYLLVCRGDNNPVSQALIICNADRTRGADPQSAEGTATWTRPSGTGQAWWSNSAMVDGDKGQLELRFDDDARKPCGIEVFGTTTGRELYENWLPSAPI